MESSPQQALLMMALSDLCLLLALGSELSEISGANMHTQVLRAACRLVLISMQGSQQENASHLRWLPVFSKRTMSNQLPHTLQSKGRWINGGRPDVWHQQLPCVLRAGQCCMQAGADPNTKEPAGIRRINVAACAQHKDIVELMLPCIP